MFHLTEEAKQELQQRLSDSPNRFVRLQMRHSCYMKLKLTLEETSKDDDVHVAMDGIDFIIDKNHVHYFRNKKIDFIPDVTGFKQFEAV